MAMSQPSKKRKCFFSENLQKEFPFLLKCSTVSDVWCTICSGTFSVANGGRYGIQRHLKTDKHQKAVIFSNSSSPSTSWFPLNKYSEKEAESAKAECMWAFHTVKHSQSLDSIECASLLIEKLSETQVSCDKTRSESIVKNVIDPHASAVLVAELEDVPFVSVFTDVSSLSDFRMFPLLLRYFHPKTGINIKLLDLVDSPGETSDVNNALFETLKKHDLEDKVVGFCGGDVNRNFGSDSRYEVLFKLQENLDRKIVGVGCAIHTALSALQTAADLFPVDVELVVTKIYSYFHAYSVRVEALEEFCEHFEMHLKQSLECSKTRWLALLPALEKVLQKFSTLKLYFLSQAKCPGVLVTFFTNGCSELWLKFVRVQAAIFHSTVKMMAGDKTSFTEISHLILDLRNKFASRLENDYVPSCVRSDLSKLEETGQITHNDFMHHARTFYGNCVDYMDQYISEYKDFKSFNWIKLRHPPKWNDVLHTYEQLQQSAKNIISEDDLFDEITFVSNYIDDDVMKRWEDNIFDSETRWLEVFENFQNASVPHKNCLLLVQFLLCLPGTNSPTARILSLMNEIWTHEMTAINKETMSSMLRLKFNMGSCEGFHEILNETPDLVEKCYSFENSKLEQENQ